MSLSGGHPFQQFQQNSLSALYSNNSIDGALGRTKSSTLGQAGSLDGIRQSSNKSLGGARHLSPSRNVGTTTYSSTAQAVALYLPSQAAVHGATTAANRTRLEGFRRSITDIPPALAPPISPKAATSPKAALQHGAMAAWPPAAAPSEGARGSLTQVPPAEPTSRFRAQAQVKPRTGSGGAVAAAAAPASDDSGSREGASITSPGSAELTNEPREVYVDEFSEGDGNASSEDEQEQEEGGGAGAGSLLGGALSGALARVRSGVGAALAQATSGVERSLGSFGVDEEGLPRLQQQQQQQAAAGGGAVRFKAAAGGARAAAAGGGSGGPSRSLSRSVSRANSQANLGLSISRAGSMTAGGGGGGGRAPGAAGLYHIKWLDFGLSPDQASAKQAAETLARSVLARHAGKADESRMFPCEALAAAGLAGFGGVAVPASLGGMGLGDNDACVVFEALGMGDTAMAGLLTIHNMVAWIVAKFGSPALQQQVGHNLASLNVLGGYAATEPAGGSDPSSVATTAAPGGAGYVINGHKAYVAGAGVADVFLLLARTSEQPTRGLSLFLVNQSLPGLSVGRAVHSGAWRAVPIAPLTLTNCAVRAECLLGREGMGMDILNAGLERQRLWLSAVSVGGAQLALDYAISHGRTRKQETKTITDFQAVQFKVVDCHAQLQAARLMVRSAAQQADAGAPTRSLEVCMAKQFATDTAAQVAAEACSLMGAAGMVCEHPVERIARDLRAHTVVGGSNDQMVGRAYQEMSRGVAPALGA